MAFPTIPLVADGRVLTGVQTGTSATRTFPNLSSLTKSSGDLLIAIIAAYQTTATANAAFSGWTTGWTEFIDQSSSTTMAIGAAYKWSTGSETGTISVTQAATITGDAAFIILAIPGAHSSTPPEASTIANGTSSMANPPLLDPTGWGAEDTLWIIVESSGETSVTGSFTGLAVQPANYTNPVETSISQDAVGGTQLGVAFRQLNATSEDPGVWSGDTSNARSSALTIAVRPGITIWSLAVADDLGFASTVAINRETFIATADDLGFSSTANLIVDKSLQVSDDLGFAAAANLTRETFMQVADDLGFASTIDLMLEGGAPATTGELPPIPEVMSSGMGW